MNKKTVNSRFMQVRLLMFILVIFCCSITGYSQVVIEDDNLLPPAEEKFEEADSLAVPWRESGCQKVAFEFNEPNCEVIKDFYNAHILTIYNEDGSLWYRFSLNARNSDYFYKNMKQGFSPFSIFVKDYGTPNALILRMVGESKHWYKVEINEETRATKFVLKSDPMWAKSNWSYWIYKSTNLIIDSKQTKLHDKPEGKIIDEFSEIDFQRVVIKKVEGEWVLVKDFINEKWYQGWIRWRDDRRILVGCIFNGYKLPTQQVNESRDN